MATVFTGDREVFRSMTYAQPQDSYLDHVEDRYSSTMSNLTGNAKALFTKSRDNFVKVRNSDSLRKAKAIMRQVGSLWGRDIIQELKTVTEVQNAPFAMRDYIMANPEIRNIYHAGGCEGYGKSYVDQQPGVVGEEHLDYQKVKDGYVEIDENGDFSATTYSNNFLDDVKPDLTHDEQVDIHTAWDLVRNAVYFGVDPTSKRDADL